MQALAASSREEQVQDPQSALGPADGQHARLLPGATLLLQVGGCILPGSDGAPDFTLVGEVTSGSTLRVGAHRCATDSPTGGAFLVEVGGPGTTERPVGYWGRVVRVAADAGVAAGELRLACGGFAGCARWVRLTAIGEAFAELDALQVHSCVQ